MDVDGVGRIPRVGVAVVAWIAKNLRGVTFGYRDIVGLRWCRRHRRLPRLCFCFFALDAVIAQPVGGFHHAIEAFLLILCAQGRVRCSDAEVFDRNGARRRPVSVGHLTPGIGRFIDLGLAQSLLLMERQHEHTSREERSRDAPQARIPLSPSALSTARFWAIPSGSVEPRQCRGLWGGKFFAT